MSADPEDFEEMASRQDAYMQQRDNERARLQTLLDRYRALAKAADVIRARLDADIGLMPPDEADELLSYDAASAAVREIEDGSSGPVPSVPE